MAVQLQPQTGNLSQWVAIAGQEGASFEIPDLFFPPAVGDGQLRRTMIRQYRETGLAGSLHGAFIDVNPGSGDPRIREISRQRCRESCEAAIALGARNVVFHSGAFPFLRGGYLELWADSCAAFYESLSGEFGLNLFIENAQDTDPAPLRALMDRISGQRVGVCLDIGHAGYSRAPLDEWFEQLQDRIGYLHLSDNAGSFDDHLPLGAGVIDWELADRLYRDLGRELPITLETGTAEATVSSLRFLRQKKYFGLG